MTNADRRDSPQRMQKRRTAKAGVHRDLYAPKWIFSRNTASKCHGRRQPCRGIFLCLAGNSLILECFAVLNRRFFLAGIFRGSRNTGCISRTMDFLRGKRFFQNRVNPYAHPPKGRDFCYWNSSRYFATDRVISRAKSLLYFRLQKACIHGTYPFSPTLGVHISSKSLSESGLYPFSWTMYFMSTRSGLGLSFCCWVG